MSRAGEQEQSGRGAPGRGGHYVVTGGAGFIGSHVVEALLRRGSAVTVLDNFTTGNRANLEAALAAVPGAAEPRVIDGSVTDPRTVARALEGAVGVVHLAALPSVVRSVEAPLESHEHNVTGTLVVLDAARQHGTKVVYAGSSSAYGDQEAALKSEDLREAPLSPYAASKLAGELYCRVFARVYGLPVVVTRFFNVYGPRQVPDSPYSGVVAAFCFALLNGTPPRIDGDGLQSRDFTYVEDVAGGILLALDAEITGCLTVNLACSGNHTILELLDVLRSHSGVDVEAVHGAPRNGDVRHSRADITRIRETLGYAPRISFTEGLRRTFDWYRSNHHKA